MNRLMQERLREALRKVKYRASEAAKVDTSPLCSRCHYWRGFARGLREAARIVRDGIRGADARLTNVSHFRGGRSK